MVYLQYNFIISVLGNRVVKCTQGKTANDDISLGMDRCVFSLDNNHTSFIGYATMLMLCVVHGHFPLIGQLNYLFIGIPEANSCAY